MKTKYYCDECCELFFEEEISYKYQININGKFPVWEYVCKECSKKGERQ